MSVRAPDFQVVVISWEKKEPNSVLIHKCSVGREVLARRKKKKSSDNRVISGFLFFLFRSILTRILPFTVRLFDSCTCANGESGHIQIYIHTHIFTRDRLEEELSEGKK